VISFFLEGADVHRRAAEKRYAEKKKAEGDRYIDNEIALRRRFLETALRADLDGKDNEELRRATVRHLSALAGALARRQQYVEVDKVLADTAASVIDGEAVRVWLQAVWSCAKFDGSKGNLCTEENKAQCKEKIELFLSSVDQMKGRSFPPQTQRDIDALRRLTGEGGCLR
jgi:hypothetical protein